MRAIVIAGCLLVAAWPAAVWPQDGPPSAVVQRPTETETAVTVAPRYVEFDGGLFLGEDLIETPATVRFGLVRGAELLAAVSPIVIHDSGEPNERSGVGDLAAGAKIWFVDQGVSMPALALQGLVKLPTGEDAVSSGELDYSITAIATRRYSQLVADLNGGIDLLGRDKANGDHVFDEIWRAGASAVWMPQERFSYVAELYGRFVPDQDIDQVTLNLGLIYGANETFLIDGAVRLGLSEDASDAAITFGLTKLLGKGID